MLPKINNFINFSEEIKVQPSQFRESVEANGRNLRLRKVFVQASQLARGPELSSWKKGIRVTWLGKRTVLLGVREEGDLVGSA